MFMGGVLWQVAEQPCCQFTKTEMRSISAWRKSTGSASMNAQRNEDEVVEGRLQAAPSQFSRSMARVRVKVMASNFGKTNN